jgi:hypothetical protein
MAGPVTTKVCKMAIWRVCSVPEVLDHRRREIGLDFGEARVLAPDGELACELQPALVGVADGQHEIHS